MARQVQAILFLIAAAVAYGQAQPAPFPPPPPMGAITESRPLCPYPLVAKYKGSGSTDDAANFVCSKGF